MFHSVGLLKSSIVITPLRPTNRSGVAAWVKTGCGEGVFVAGNHTGVVVTRGVGVAGRGVAVMTGTPALEQAARELNYLNSILLFCGCSFP